MGKQRRERDNRASESRDEFDERVLDIKRVAKVMKGGRRFAFRTVVIVGDNRGTVGVGTGKARGVPDAIRKGTDRARRNMKKVSLVGTTIPHPITAKFGGAEVMLRPASPGTGVIAGGAVRAVVEAAGIKDILTKSKGSNNMLNVARATLLGLQQLQNMNDVAAARGKERSEVAPFWLRKRQGSSE